MYRWTIGLHIQLFCLAWESVAWPTLQSTQFRMSKIQSFIGCARFWQLCQNPLHVCENAANLKDKTKEIFSSVNRDLFSCKKILFCPPDWLHSHAHARGLLPKGEVKSWTRKTHLPSLDLSFLVLTLTELAMRQYGQAAKPLPGSEAAVHFAVM